MAGFASCSQLNEPVVDNPEENKEQPEYSIWDDPYYEQFMTLGDLGSFLNEDENQAFQGFKSFPFKLIPLFNEVVAADANFAFSPVTEALATIMLNGATDPASQAKINDLFGSPDFATLQTTASYVNRVLPKQRNGAFLMLNSSVWYDDHFTPTADYAESMNTLFNAPCESFDCKDPAGTAARINAWACDATQGAIPTLVSADDLKETIAMWTSAIYFCGEWQDKFNKELTHKAPFYSLEGEIEVDMMHNDNVTDGQYAQRDGWEMVSFRFNGRTFFRVVLPPADMDMAEATALLDKARFDDMKNHGRFYDSVKMHFEMPKFEFKNQLDLLSVYNTLGIDYKDGSLPAFGLPFIPSFKSFQSATIKLDEDGATAAAVTYQNIAWSTFEKPESKEIFITVDRPFFFFFEAGDVCFFTGRVVTP